MVGVRLFFHSSFLCSLVHFVLFSWFPRFVYSNIVLFHDIPGSISQFSIFNLGFFSKENLLF